MTKATKQPKVFAVSQERWRASAAEKRLYGGSTMTKFLVGFEGSDPSTWRECVAGGATPGDRKAAAIQQFLKSVQPDNG